MAPSGARPEISRSSTALSACLEPNRRRRDVIAEPRQRVAGQEAGSSTAPYLCSGNIPPPPPDAYEEAAAPETVTVSAY